MCMNCPHSSVCSDPNVARSVRPGAPRSPAALDRPALPAPPAPYSPTRLPTAVPNGSLGAFPKAMAAASPGQPPSRAAPSRRALLPFPGRGGAARRYGSGAAAITCGPGRAAPPRGAEPQRRPGPGSCASGCGAKPARRRRAPRPPLTRHRAARSTGSSARGEEPRLGAACWRPARGEVRRKKRHELPRSARTDRFCGRKKFGLNAGKLACRSPQKTEVEKELTPIPFPQSPHVLCRSCLSIPQRGFLFGVTIGVCHCAALSQV